MALARLACVNHPDRTAQGLCVVTGKAVCAECSTRRDGVNLSHEGLALLAAQRDAVRGRDAGRDARAVWRSRLFLPAGLVALALAYWFWAAAILRLLAVWDDQ